MDPLKDANRFPDPKFDSEENACETVVSSTMANAAAAAVASQPPHDTAASGGLTHPVTMAEKIATEARDPEASPDTTTQGAADGDDPTTRVFQFLSTAPPETLAGIGVGLVAITYFILGQLGLLLIGAFAGVSAFISWEAKNPQFSQSLKRETLTKILDSKGGYLRDGDGKQTDEAQGDQSTELKGFEDFQPETRAALNGLVDAVIRIYVTPLVPWDQEFALACRKVLNGYLISISNRLSKKRPADTFLDFLTNSSSIVIVFFSELSTAMTEFPPNNKRTAAESINSYLSSNPDSNLANLLNKKQQAAKLRLAAEDLLAFLDRPTYNCDPARLFLRETLAGVILEMTLSSCAKAEWINGWIVYLLEAGEPDFNQAIDVGMQTGPDVIKGLVESDAKSSRNSVEVEKSQSGGPMSPPGNKLSKADEEMEVALEEMKKLNQMIAEEDARRKRASAMEEPKDGLLDMQQGAANQQQADASHDSLSPKNTADPAGDITSDEQSADSVGLQSPTSPLSVGLGASTQSLPAPHGDGGNGQFTSFDQIVPPASEDAETSDSDPVRGADPPPLTLHNATITIHDDGTSDSASRIRNRPNWDYLIQVEPATSFHPGWMIVRKYSDFEQLHEVLARLAKISGATDFTEQHGTLPGWRAHTKASLRENLERYCRDACRSKPLALSEGLRRFLEKDVTHTRGQSKSGFEAFENMGKNVFGVLTNAPKGVADGVVGGVTGVLGNLGLGSRKNTGSSSQQPPQLDTNGAALMSNGTAKRHSMPPMAMASPSPSRHESGLSIASSRKGRDSMDSQRSLVMSTQPGKVVVPMERQPSYNSQLEGVEGPAGDTGSLRPDSWELASPNSASRNASRASSRARTHSASSISLSGLKLPPPPTEIPDDYDGTGNSTKPTTLQQQEVNAVAAATTEAAAAPSPPLSRSASTSGLERPPKRQARTFKPLTEQEASVAVELLFAVITELFTLSPSAWNIRRTLLSAAKSFLLRPGNPSLESIRLMMQETVLDSVVSDEYVAAQLRKLRENSLPTDEEYAAWPAELPEEEKAKLRVKARRLLIENGMPVALSGLMGQAAKTEALGRVFDCLQVEEVARGLLFGILLQAIRAITH